MVDIKIFQVRKKIRENSCNSWTKFATFKKIHKFVIYFVKIVQENEKYSLFCIIYANEHQRGIGTNPR
jgi:hypothetical protein